MNHRGEGTDSRRHSLGRWGTAVLLPGLALLLSACTCGLGLANRLSAPPYVRLIAGPEANNTSAVAVDVVLVYDAALVEALREMTARVWFDQRNQLRKDHPNPKKSYESFLLELVPGQAVRQVLPRLTCARAGFVYADYRQSGVHRERFASNLDSLVVELGRDGFTLEPSASAPSESP